jgi:hypothetical protein
VIENECEVGIAQAVASYNELINKKFGDFNTTYSREDLENALNEAKDQALSELGGINHIKDRDPEIYEKHYD